MASRTFDTPIMRIPSTGFILSIFTFGSTQVVNPNLAASATLWAAWDTPRTSPERPTSPKISIPGSTVFIAGHQCHDNGKVQSRFTHTHAAGDIYIGIQTGQFVAAPFLQHCHQKVYTVVIRTCRCSSWHTKICLRYQCLNLQKDRPCAL